ncbi:MULTISPECIES: DUF1521 domain-containing protein [unclassified Roseateles]|uniref:DUF1521 domain-containing protein n=1 Tax=unclassified Roseateles TaxID=2626991 RepID=UPI0006FB39A4|nr:MULTISPECIES: DUF1521 domain-containing protein [unclassified Roseateles]KQW49675.1 hypothetical protein ASC81_25620 [Pelomonas sp. Root405]KRA76134.1 hypothetical protein ASD88_25570 [Pelomonas sp. Root662]
MTTIQATSTASLSTTSALSESNPTNASTKMEGGKAVFENDNYRITAGDNNEVHIFNKKTGEDYKIWGDPHVNIDGKHEFDFWGTTTFALEDGTKVTIETTPWNGNQNATVASTVNITNGDYGVQIKGVDTNKVGDLKINEAKGWGETLDWTHDDGNVLQENPAGKGFLAVDADGKIQKVDQNYINKTDLQLNAGKPAKPVDQGAQDRAADFVKDLFSMFSGLLSASFTGAFLGALAASSESREPAARDANRFSLTFVRLDF